MTKIDALKVFFGSADRPVTTKELTEFKKADPVGFEQIAQAAAAALAVEA